MEAAITVAHHITGPTRLAASALTYQYLNGGPTLLREREQVLRRLVSSLPEDARLSDELLRDLIAWATATAIVQRRPASDLPPAWWSVAPDAR